MGRFSRQIPSSSLSVEESFLLSLAPKVRAKELN